MINIYQSKLPLHTDIQKFTILYYFLFITVNLLAKVLKMDDDLKTTLSQARNKTLQQPLILHCSNNTYFESIFTSVKFTTVNNLIPGMSVSFSSQYKIILKTSRN